MKIAIVGAGAVGSYYGALLSRSGQDVVFIARGENLAALKSNGLTVKSPLGDFDVPEVNATDNPSDVGYVDLILFSVKTYDTRQAATAMLPMVGPKTAILPLQNGIMTDLLQEIAGQPSVLGGLTYIFVAREASGVIKQTSDFHRIIFGELNGEKTARVEAVRQVLDQSGITVIVPDNITTELWSKFMFISALGAISSIVKLPTGDYRNVPETRDLLARAMKEIQAVAMAKGINFDSDIVEQKLHLVDNLNPQSMTSMQRDVMAGLVSELDELVQAVNAAGSEIGVPTPTYQAIYAMLKPGEIKARQPQ